MSVWTVVVAILLVSRIPTLSVKPAKVPPGAVAPFLALIGLLASPISTYPLVALIIAMIPYLAHLPYSVQRYR